MLSCFVKKDEFGLEFNKIDDNSNCPPMTLKEKLRVRYLWIELEKREILHQIGHVSFQMLIAKRPRLLVFFHAALMEKDYSLLEKYDEDEAISQTDGKSNLSQDSPVITNSNIPAASPIGKKIMSKISSISHRSYYSAQSEDESPIKKYLGKVKKSSDKQNVPLRKSSEKQNIFCVKSSDKQNVPCGSTPVDQPITIEDLMKHKNMQTHVHIVMTSLTSLINDVLSHEKFSEGLKHVQLVHRGVDIMMRRFICKPDFAVFLQCMDEAIKVALPRYYRCAVRRSMRRFLLVIYFVITYYMPKTPFIYDD